MSKEFLEYALIAKPSMPCTSVYTMLLSRTMKRVMIIGASSARIVGGVAVHNTRLAYHLSCTRWQPVLVDIKTIGGAFNLLRLPLASLIHVNISNISGIAFFIGLGRLFRKPVIVTLHGDIDRFTASERRRLLAPLENADHIVALNARSGAHLRELKFHNLTVLSAFLPPASVAELPPDLTNRLAELRAAGRIIFCTNASRDNRDKAGAEIYGIRSLLEIFCEHREWVLVIVDQNASYRRSFERERRQLPSNVIFISHTIDFNALLQVSHVMVRATSTDGDSISVREALYWGIQTVASDAVERPEGVVTYRFGDNDSLHAQLTEAAKRSLNAQSSSTKIDNPVFHITALYQTVLDRQT
jgi:glycosyltransferase involved in cell wall biosynthesis